MVRDYLRIKFYKQLLDYCLSVADSTKYKGTKIVVPLVVLIILFWHCLAVAGCFNGHRDVITYTIPMSYDITFSFLPTFIKACMAFSKCPLSCAADN